MLAKRFSEQELARILARPGQWRPLPQADDRAAWQSLNPEVRRKFVAAGEAALEEPWPHLSATLLLDYARTGVRERYQQPEGRRRQILRNLVLAECVEGQGRFIDPIADALWSKCEESTWCWPAHLQAQKAGADLPDPDEPMVDLGVGESAALVAWSDYLLREPLAQVSPMVSKRVAREIEHRIIVPCFERDDFWWMGFTAKRVNNWCPWVVSNWLTCVLLLEREPQRRVTAVAKALRSLDKFIDRYFDDGGCDEGPSYWGHAGGSLFDCLDILHSATGGAIDIYNEPRIANMARFIHRAHISGDWYVNFADAPGRVRPIGSLVHRFGRAVGDEPTAEFGAWLAQRHGDLAGGGSIWRTLRGVFDAPELDRPDAMPPLVRDVWLDGIEVMVARDRGGSDTGLTLAAKGGNNAESHNHNDVGHFVVYHHGRPGLIDAGVGTYVRKTFSSERYDIWTMQSAYHALPTIESAEHGPVQQLPGMEFAATDVTHAADDTTATLTLDIAGAYPPEAGLARWNRRITLHRGEAVVLEDAYELDKPAAALTLALLTPSEIDLPEASASAQEPAIRLRPRDLGNGSHSAALNVRLDQAQGSRAEMSVETIPLEDPKLANVWGPALHRLILRWPEPPGTGGWTLRIEPASQGADNE